ncbi:hypothetical protein VN12_09880 [Pirellula sp. SH-Sr6A]|uniref:DUF1549 and DUF1553 domain-containing protein n=1 Tax=Pirellula sp. SH-Sr6A TaxID=1632865 RepID=UPI00078C3EAA|nr:DUF1549 and DUF1553 domain-containing protein [Pirellula sp. SH-Sr6A]AMV32423.1 hypothetical protein VN12_09880 [Pirellula sp. SH-Sr6A]
MSALWYRRSLWLLAIMLGLSDATSLLAEDVSPPLHSRFALGADGKLGSDEVPNFQKHISPLLGRLGCNGRACHGSFQGQGGFMLSLFGYDFDVDHKALLDEEAGRVNLKSPEESLILTKPTDESMHDGGKRFDKDGWEYRVLRAWIDAGAPKILKKQKESLALQKLTVAPTEISFAQPGEKVSIRAIAHWNDGTIEDVTGLCRFFSNDTAIAQVDEQGVIVAGDRGDTHVVVSYDNAVVPIAVLRPAGPTGRLTDQIAQAKTEVDRLVLKKLDKLGMEPSPVADDAEFFRRISLDVAGTLPTAEQARTFLASTDPRKREKAIDALLDSPGYAALWTTFLCDLTGNNDDQLRNFTFIRELPPQHWYQWIYARIANNTPYDEIVEGIVTAVSREPGESYREYCEAMTRIANDKTGKAYAERSDMMYFWARNNLRTSEERAIAFAYAFCGVRIQCAQCHKHPFDQWSKKDFDQFERLFDGVVANQNSLTAEGKKEFDKIVEELGVPKSAKGNDLARQLQEKFRGGAYDKTLPFPELFVQVRNDNRNKGNNKDKSKKGKQTAAPVPTARLLGGDFVDLSKVKDPREPLMTWLRDRNNPYFAKALVNRVWAHYFQAGIVNPPDDLNLANAPSNEALLQYLADRFVENGYNLKWLHRTILNTDTYQRTWQTTPTNEMDRRNFSHALLRRLPAETAYDALKIALSSDEQARSLCNLETDRAMTLAGASAQTRGRRADQYALSVFGRSVRESNCDCDRTSDPSLLQTVFIRNDADVIRAMFDPKTSWLAQVARESEWKMVSMDGRTAPEREATGRKTAMTGVGGEDSLQKSVDDLDRRVRSLRTQIERLQDKEGAKEKIRDLKSRLALTEKRLAGQSELLAKSQEQEEPSDSSSEHASQRESWNQSDSERMGQRIGEAYLRTLSRYPEPTEMRIAMEAIQKADSPVQGLSDLLWALINSKEFILNH